MKNNLIPFILCLLLLIAVLVGCASTAKLPDNTQLPLENQTQSAVPSVTSVPVSMKSEPSQVNEVPVSASANTTVPAEITKEEALSIALAHAGFTTDAVKYSRVDYEIDDRIPEYDVEFYMNNLEYEYEIHAETGAILSCEVDR